MSLRLRDLVLGELGALRHEPIAKRIRAELDGATVVDSTHAVLVWEPRRVVPSYAVPEADVQGEVVPAGSDAADAVAATGVQLDGRPVYDPSIPFAAHTAEGEPLVVRVGDREAAAFRCADPELHGHLVLDFGGFDAWYEEDERNVSHPRDPFHRIDIVHSSRPVRVEVDGAVVAESTRARFLFEAPLPARYYLPREDVRVELAPSATRSACAYKGEAHYWSLPGGEDIAWSYPAPLREAAEITDHVCFFNEQVDITLGGEPLERPVTPWSRR